MKAIMKKKMTQVREESKVRNNLKLTMRHGLVINYSKRSAKDKSHVQK